MIERKIKLNMVKDVSFFVKKVSVLECDVDLVKGRYIIDAKSVMGVMTIDVSEPVKMIIHESEDSKEIKKFLEDIDYLIVK